MTFDCGYEIASAKSNHDKYGNVCFVDGSVRNYAGNAWASNIAYYGVTTATTAGTLPTLYSTSTSCVFKDSATAANDTPRNECGKLIQ